MSNLLRSALLGSDWTYNELMAFNIEITTVSAAAFFGVADLPVPTVSDVILNNLHRPAGELSKMENQFFFYLQKARTTQETAVDDFASHLFALLDYDGNTRFICRGPELSFYMAGQRVSAKPDVILSTDDLYLLVVQENKCANANIASGDPEPQLIAESIAAFYSNCEKREEMGLPKLDSEVIPGIVMIGTSPIFYRTIVRAPLLDALATSTYPAEKTVVLRYIPPVPNMENYQAEGMLPLDNRRIIFQCFEAFKRVIGPGI